MFPLAKISWVFAPLICDCFCFIRQQFPPVPVIFVLWNCFLFQHFTFALFNLYELYCSWPAFISGPQKALERHWIVPDKWRFCRTQHSTGILNFVSHFQMLAFYDYCNMSISETYLTPWALYTADRNKGCCLIKTSKANHRMAWVERNLTDHPVPTPEMRWIGFFFLLFPQLLR